MLKEYLLMLKVLAEQHPSVRYDEDTNKSFARNQTELEKIVEISGYSSEAMLLAEMPKGFLQMGSSLLDNQVCGFEVLIKCSDTNNDDEIEDAHVAAYKIGLDMIARIYDWQLQGLHLVHSFDLNSVQYEYTGPVKDGYYGCAFRFTLDASPIDIYAAEERQEYFTADLENRKFTDQFNELFS